MCVYFTGYSISFRKNVFWQQFNSEFNYQRYLTFWEKKIMINRGLLLIEFARYKIPDSKIERNYTTCLRHPVYAYQTTYVGQEGEQGRWMLVEVVVACLSRYVGCGPERIRSRSCLDPRRINPPPVIDEYLRRMVITCETSCIQCFWFHLNCILAHARARTIRNHAGINLLLHRRYTAFFRVARNRIVIKWW